MKVDPVAAINSFRAPRFSRDSARRSQKMKAFIRLAKYENYLLIRHRLRIDFITIEVEMDDHGSAADFAVVVPLRGRLIWSRAGDGECLETGGAGDVAVH